MSSSSPSKRPAAGTAAVPSTTTTADRKRRALLPQDLDPIDVYVYDQPKPKKGETIPNDPTRIQGVWQEYVSTELSPCLLWLYPKVPSNIQDMKENKAVFGVWGYHPDHHAQLKQSPSPSPANDPHHLWFYGPKSRPPKFFTPIGIWMHPLVERSTSHLKEFEQAFLTVGESRSKTEKLDVGGQWKLLYQNDGKPKEEERKGPGMSPRVPKSKVKPPPLPIQVHVQVVQAGDEDSPKDRRPKFSLTLPPTTAIQDIQPEIERQANIPTPQQKLYLTDHPTPSKDSPLIPSQTLQDAKIQDGDTIYVVLPAMQIHVQDWKGQRTTYTVQPKDNLSQIKERVAERQSIPIEQQRIWFPAQKKALSNKFDRKSLQQLGIEHDDVLELLPMQIYIQPPEENRPKFPLIVSPDDTIQDIQKQVASKTGIPIPDQRLFFLDEPLLDKNTNTNTNTIDQVGIQHGDTLDLKPMMVHVRDWNGKTQTYPVVTTMPLQSLQQQIAQQQKIPIPQQRIFLGNKSVDKDPTSTLQKIGIQHDDTLDLLPMEITVKTPDGKIIPLQVTPKDTVKDIKKKVADKENIPVQDQRLQFNGKPLTNDKHTLDDLGIQHGDTVQMEGMKIHVRDWNGNKATYDVSPTDALQDVKEQVEKRQKIPVKQQRVSFQQKPLEDDSKTLKKYGIQHDDTLDLLPMVITVKTPDGKSIPLEVNPEDTVKDIKKKVAYKENIPVEEQRLQFNGKPLDNDIDTLKDLGIQHGDTVQMKEMKIHVRDWNGNKATYDVSPNDSLQDVKEQVAKRQKIPIEQQRVSYQKKSLEDDSKTLKKYGIQHDDILDLLPMLITVKTPDGKSVPLEVTPEDTVKDIKKKVTNKENIPVEDQRLQFNGNPLDEDKDTLKDLGIQHGDTVQMEGMKIHVRHWNGKEATYDVSPSDTLQDIKEKVAKQQKLPIEQQRVSFQEKPLKDDTKSLKKYGIQHDDTLHLLPMVITVKTPDGKLIPLEVMPEDTVKDIKKKVADKENIPVEDQRLQFNGKPLDIDEDTLDDLGIQHGDTVQMEGMKIHVRHWNGKKETYDVSPKDTLQDVKNQVAKRQNVPIEQQRVSFQQKPLKDDTKSLKKYGIQHDDTLNLSPMVITVKTPDGKSIPVEVTPDDTVKDIKKKVADKENIPVDDQRLQFNDKPLDNDKVTLDDLGMQHGDTVQMEGMQIHVRHWNGKKETYDVSPKDTLQDVKNQVAKRQNVPIEQQRVSFQQKPLKDDTKSLKKYGIQHDDTLNLSPMVITVKTPDGKSIPVEVTPDDTVKDIKKKVADKENIPVDDQRLQFNDKPLDNDKVTLGDLGMQHGDTVQMEGMQIHARDWNGKTATYDVSPNDTLQDVKEQIAKRQKIPIKQQRVSFQQKPLKDDAKSLKQYGIQHDDKLDLLPMMITVKTPDGKSVPLEVSPQDTVKDIKKKVADKENIPLDEQRLQHNGNPLDIDKDTLDDLGIQHGDTVQMEGMKIHVRDWNGNKATYDVSPKDTLQDVKEQVAKRQKIPIDQQRVAFERKPLEDDSKTLKKHGIEHDDTLDLLPMMITVKTPDGKSIPLEVSPQDTVKDIKEKVADKENIPVEDQRLQFNGKPLDNNKDTLKDLGIQHGDKVQMEGMKIHVRDWNGKTKTYDVTPNDTLQDIKEKVAKRQKIPLKQQRVSFQQTPLEDDSKTLKKYSIQHDDTLDLLPMMITVKTPDGKLVPLEVTPDDTVKNIKKEVAEKEGIPEEKQRLQFNGKPLTKDKKTLDDLGVKHGDVIEMEGMKIHVRDLKGKTETYDVSPYDTLKDIKQQVAQRQNVPIEQQRLAFHSTPLEDDRLSLKGYGVKNDDALDLLPMQIHAKLPNGRKVTLTVEPSDTIKDVKDKIEEVAKIPASDQKIEFKNYVKKDFETLEDAGIVHDDTLVVKLQLQSPRKTPATPKKKSYLPANWKEERERYGEVITTYYEVDHDVDEDEHFIRGISKEEREKFSMKSPTRQSKKK